MSKRTHFLQSGVGVGLIHKPADIDIRRNISVKLLPDTYASVRIYCLKRGICIQELLEELLQHVIIGDARVEKIIDELVEAKREKYYKKLSATDAESIFDDIARESPFKDE